MVPITEQPIDSSGCKKITIGVIDSGVDKNHHAISNVIEGYSFLADNSDDAWSDQVGHGTACAYIINNIAPDAIIIPVKVLNPQLETTLESVISAIYLLADKEEVFIINLSIGSTDKVSKELERACDYAYSKNKIIVAAASDSQRLSFPAAYNSVIGVGSVKLKGKNEYLYDPNSFPGLFANGDRQRLAWKDNSYIFLGGSSFAAPRISAILALIWQANPHATASEIINILFKQSPIKKSLDTTKDEIEIKISESRALTFMNTVLWIKKAHLYPFNKEMYGLIRYKEMLPFEITGITDFIGNAIKGKSVFERTNIHNSDIKIGYKLEADILEADTIILGHLEPASRSINKDLTEKVLQIALKLNKNIFSFSPLYNKSRIKYVELAAEKGLRFVSPELGNTQFVELGQWLFDADKNVINSNISKIEELKPKINNWLENFSANSHLQDIPVPILAILGTGPQQGKFSLQILLRKLFMRDNYRLLQIGTEPQSQLFGFDFTYPTGFESGIQSTPVWNSLLINRLLNKFFDMRHPDIVLAGLQSGLVPYDLSAVVNTGFPNISFLMGLKADICLLTVNSIDPLKFVSDNIEAIRMFGKCRTIGLVVGPLSKYQDKKSNKIINTFQTITTEEAEEAKRRFSHGLDLPCFSLVNEDDHELIYKCILDFLHRKE